MIRTLTIVAALGLAGAAHAQYEYNQLTPQQARIKACYTAAGSRHLKGKEESRFIDHCLRPASHETSSAAGSGRLKR